MTYAFRVIAREDKGPVLGVGLQRSIWVEFATSLKKKDTPVTNIISEGLETVKTFVTNVEDASGMDVPSIALVVALGVSLSALSVLALLLRTNARGNNDTQDYNMDPVRD